MLVISADVGLITSLVRKERRVFSEQKFEKENGSGACIDYSGGAVRRTAVFPWELP